MAFKFTVKLDKKKYRIGKLLGEGTNGCVVKVLDRRTKKYIAVKQVFNVFASCEFAKQSMREVRILSSLKHENILQLNGVNVIGCDLYIITEHCKQDLGKWILHEKISGNSFSWKYLSLMHQVLSGINFTHKAGFIHRDIKPANILVTSNLQVKLCDYGCARICPGENDMETAHASRDDLTEYVASRWYRAPEIILSPRQYGKPMDLWAAGCTFAEMILKNPLFPGKSYVDQLHVIVSILGSPTFEDLNFSMSRRARAYIESIGRECPILSNTLGDLFIDDDVLQLISGLLRFNPTLRMTADEAQCLPVFDEYKRQFVRKPAGTQNTSSTASAASVTAAIEACPLRPDDIYDLLHCIVDDIQRECREQESLCKRHSAPRQYTQTKRHQHPIELSVFFIVQYTVLRVCHPSVTSRLRERNLSHLKVIRYDHCYARYSDTAHTSTDLRR